MTELLTLLCALDGVSGHESRVRAFIRETATPYADTIREDVMGNLLVFKRGRRAVEHPPLLCAHMDEVGLMVKDITPEGYLTFGTVGGIDRRLLPGKRVRRDRLIGVVGLPPIHLTKPEDRARNPRIHELCIDIGAQSRQEALRRVALGDAFAFNTMPQPMGNGFFKAKALDDRLGCAVLLETLSADIPIDTWFAFTVQEEVGTRGAYTAAYALKPRAALVVEGTTAADLPNLSDTDRTAAAGEGIVLSYADGSTLYDHRMHKAMRRLCEQHRIPYQHKRALSGGTDAAALSQSHGGTRVCGLAAAVRYIHAPASLVSLEDADNLVKAAALFLENYDAIIG